MKAEWRAGRTVVCAAVVMLAVASCASQAVSVGGGAPSLQPSTASSVEQSGTPVTSPPGTPTTTPPKLFATITALPPDPTLSVGGDWLQFTATITNGTSSTATQIAPVLSLGHCTCSNPEVGAPPIGQMQTLDPATGTWHDITFDPEGTGADYRYVAQVTATDLAPGASRLVTYRIRINAQQPYPIHAGIGTIDVSVVTHPGPSAEAVGDQANAHVRYATG